MVFNIVPDLWEEQNATTPRDTNFTFMHKSNMVFQAELCFQFNIANITSEHFFSFMFVSHMLFVSEFRFVNLIALYTFKLFLFMNCFNMFSQITGTLETFATQCTQLRISLLMNPGNMGVEGFFLRKCTVTVWTFHRSFYPMFYVHMFCEFDIGFKSFIANLTFIESNIMFNFHMIG